MAGHNKWSQIKRKKAVTDAKRGKLFTKLLREIQSAAKVGGANPDANPRLKTAILAAKAMSVPNDTIERAAKRGAGDVEGAIYEEILYEGYGAGGVAVLVKALTDNKNRTVADVRHAFTKCNGNLGSSNSVAFQFNERGMLYVPKNVVDEAVLMEAALNAGALDIDESSDEWEITTHPKDFLAVKESLEKLSASVTGEIRMIPQSTVAVRGGDAENVLKLVEMLEDLDDVQSVFGNFEIEESELEAMRA